MRRDAASPGRDAGPLSAPEFARLMAAVGPFEPQPRVAVAVSGGPDSLALTLLADEWARGRGGTAVALTVDHGLRRGSLAEARRVGAWLRGRGVAHHTLRWRGPKPATGVQAAAREARYGLLTGWCRAHGVLHLLLAHQMEDQAETFLLRLARGSGPDGLACMPAVSETPWLRLLRPLLGVPQGRLRAHLEARGQAWIDDPSNRDPAFARSRVRNAMSGLEAAGLSSRRLAQAARRMGAVRAALDAETGRLLARCAAVYPAGFCRFDGMLLAAAPREIGLRALARIVMCVGGRPHAPRSERLDRLYRAIAEGGPARRRTLGGCVFARRRDGILVTREPSAASERRDLAGGGEILWDRRFRIVPGRAAGRPLTVAALGGDGWAGVAGAAPEARTRAVPAPARLSLPAVWGRGGVVAVPHLGYGSAAAGADGLARLCIRFSPAQSLTAAPFTVV